MKKNILLTGIAVFIMTACQNQNTFNTIPHTVLIDKDGVIIERGLRGDALKFKLEELFGK